MAYAPRNRQQEPSGLHDGELYQLDDIGFTDSAEPLYPQPTHMIDPLLSDHPVTSNDQHNTPDQGGFRALRETDPDEDTRDLEETCPLWVQSYILIRLKLMRCQLRTRIYQKGQEEESTRPLHQAVPTTRRISRKAAGAPDRSPPVQPLSWLAYGGIIWELHLSHCSVLQHSTCGDWAPSTRGL